MMIQLDRNMICLLRICCDDGCITIIYTNTQQDANSKDKESETYVGTRNEWEDTTLNIMYVQILTLIKPHPSVQN
jgi:hypothetical protein